jgi:DNA phosphorothioation-dependent restriction protein DptH
MRLQPLRDGVDEDCHAAASRVTETLRSAYKLSDAQATYLTNKIRDCLELYDGVCSIPGFIRYANTCLEGKERERIVLSIERLENFSHGVHCGTDSFDWQLDTPGITVLDFSRVPTEWEQRLLVELSLADIWGQRLRKQDAQIPTVIVLDECQKYKFKPDNYTTNLLREGRKYQMSGWFASQWISDDETLAALEQAALRAYFRPEPSNVQKLAKRLAAGDKDMTKTYEKHLSRLRVGQFLYRDLNGRPIIANVQAGN